MSLRTKLFLLLGGVLSILLAAEWWLGRTLLRQVTEELDQVAFTVGDAFATSLALRGAGGGDSVQVELTGDFSAGEAVLAVRGSGLDERIPIPQGGLQRAVDRFHRSLLLGSLVLLGVGLATAGLVAHRVTAPLRELRDAAAVIGRGELGWQVRAPASGEVGGAVEAFNRMSARLRELDEESQGLRAREHLSELGEVARGLAHGLRNPLNALGLSLEELAAGDDSKSELAAASRRQIRRIDEALRSFLAIASSDGTDAEQALDVGALVEDVVLEVSQDPHARAHVSTSVAGDLPDIVGVPAEVRAAVQALVVNAVEASPVDGRVVVDLRPAGPDAVEIQVDDEGPGLSAEVRERLFTPHVTTKASGSGMGLYVAHRIATARHRGSLELGARADGSGTRATLCLRSSREPSRA